MLFLIFCMPSLHVYYWMLILKMTRGGSLTQMRATANLETWLPFLGQGGKVRLLGLEGRAANKSQPVRLCPGQLSNPPLTSRKLFCGGKGQDNAACSHHRLLGKRKLSGLASKADDKLAPHLQARPCVSFCSEAGSL